MIRHSEISRYRPNSVPDPTSFLLPEQIRSEVRFVETAGQLIGVSLNQPAS